MLLLNAGIVLSRDKIMDQVWGFDYEGESRTVDMHIKTLRQKLGSGGSSIKTVRNVGYKMDREISLIEGNTPCQYSYQYESIIGGGYAELVEDEQEKSKALAKIMKHQTGKEFDDFVKNPKLSRAVAIIKLTAEEYSCKSSV